MVNSFIQATILAHIVTKLALSAQISELVVARNAIMDTTTYTILPVLIHALTATMRIQKILCAIIVIILVLLVHHLLPIVHHACHRHT